MTRTQADESADQPARLRLNRLGSVVVKELVELIVTGQLGPGQSLPPEAPLSDQFGVSRTVIRESVKRLEEKGLVVREVDPGDTRARRLRLTPKGQELAQHAVTEVERADAEFFRSVPDSTGLIAMLRPLAT